MADSTLNSPRDLSFGAMLRSLVDYARKNALQAVLFVALVAVFVYFYGYVPLWNGGTHSTSAWAWSAWNPEGNQEHGRLVVPAVLFLVWYHRRELAEAPKQGSNWGLLFVAVGVLMFIGAARTVQARMAIVALPFLVFGAAYYLWGRRVARILLFPCALLIFAVPFGALEQATFQLQFIITGIVGALSHLFGIKIQAVGTTLSAAADAATGVNPWNFDIAEGCSGIRSLMAMTMITALYVHLTQDKLWKKVVIFCASAIFAIIGNAGRIFTIVLVAKYWDPKIASGMYHDYSGFIFFPIALAAMLAFGALINWKTGARSVVMKIDRAAHAGSLAESHATSGTRRVKTDDR
ncbi:MAG TPA: exosortase/archaeosortase family protein [Chthoniobacterales bacterium]